MGAAANGTSLTFVIRRQFPNAAATYHELNNLMRRLVRSAEELVRTIRLAEAAQNLGAKGKLVFQAVRRTVLMRAEVDRTMHADPPVPNAAPTRSNAPYVGRRARFVSSTPSGEVQSNVEAAPRERVRGKILSVLKSLKHMVGGNTDTRTTGPARQAVAAIVVSKGADELLRGVEGFASVQEESQPPPCIFDAEHMEGTLVADHRSAFPEAYGLSDSRNSL